MTVINFGPAGGIEAGEAQGTTNEPRDRMLPVGGPRLFDQPDPDPGPGGGSPRPTTGILYPRSTC